MKTATLGIIHNDLEFVKKELKEIKIPHLPNKKKKNRVNPYLEKGLQKSGLTEEKADELANKISEGLAKRYYYCVLRYNKRKRHQ